MGNQAVKRDPAVPDPHLFEAYENLTPSQKALLDQLVVSLTRQSRSSRQRLYASRVLRMAALTMATGVPIAVAASAPNLVVALLGGAAALLRAPSKCFAMRSGRSSRSDATSRSCASWKTSWRWRTITAIPTSDSSCSLTD